MLVGNYIICITVRILKYYERSPRLIKLVSAESSTRAAFASCGALALALNWRQVYLLGVGTKLSLQSVSGLLQLKQSVSQLHFLGYGDGGGQPLLRVHGCDDATEAHVSQTAKARLKLASGS